MDRSDGIIKSFKTSLKNFIGLKSESVPVTENAIGVSVQQTTMGLLNNLLDKARMEHKVIAQKISNKNPENLTIEPSPQITKMQKQELVSTEKNLIKRISNFQIKIRALEDNQALCKEEFPNLLNSFPPEHKTLVLKEMAKVYFENLELSPEWKQMSDYEKHAQFISKLQNHLNLSESTTTLYQSLFK